MKPFVLLLCLIGPVRLAAQEAVPVEAAAKPAWITLFNGKDLTGWTPKIKGHALGKDPMRTFRVKDGVLQVNYDGYGGTFDERFGHLFYATPYSHYRLELEYRFFGDQMKGGPGWAFRNSGIMIHGQAAESLTKGQKFPVSIEVQLLGGSGKGKRSTGNLCTPGTHVVLNGKLRKAHCTNSRSDTFHGDGWVKIEVEVHGSETIIHRINGKAVLEYEKPQLDPNDRNAKPLVEKRKGALLLESGTLSLQAESHPCEFRNIRLLPLRKEAGGGDKR